MAVCLKSDLYKLIFLRRIARIYTNSVFCVGEIRFNLEQK
jgi:hypothetical protein